MSKMNLRARKISVYAFFIYAAVVLVFSVILRYTYGEFVIDTYAIQQATPLLTLYAVMLLGLFVWFIMGCLMIFMSGGNWFNKSSGKN